MTVISDWEINAPDAATMIAGGIATGLLPPDTTPQSTMPIDKLFDNGTLVSINFYGAKLLPTGGTTTDANGTTVPVMAAQPGVYAILRYLPGPGQPEFDPATMTGPGCTTIPLPADSPVVFA